LPDINLFRSKSKLPLHAGKIEDYALIGDCETAALVSRSGSIDWLCWPTFSSGACFAALLGTQDHGFWKIAPVRTVESTSRRYLGNTLIVETTFTTSSGTAVVVDFMPPRGSNSDIVRIVRGVSGRVKMQMELAIRFDFGRTVPWVTHTDFGLRAIAGPDMVVLRTKAKLKGEGMCTMAEFTVRPGDVETFTLTYGSSIGKSGNEPEVDPKPFNPIKAFDDTVDFWEEWISRNQYKGEFAESVTRSLITLKALTYHPSGGIVAAPTTSLPEFLGGRRNWDYRFCWLRDTAFTLLVLLQAGYVEEAAAWRRWLLRAIAGSPGQIQTIYGINGERQLPEYIATWLPGYENSQPVNIGNAASDQFQLDVFGEVAAALARIPQATDDLKLSAPAVEAQLIDHLCHVWDQPDDGIWETRGGRKHFVHSKVMAWVALDRAIKNYERYDGGGDVKRWRKNRDMIHKQVCEKGFNKRLNAFTQSYGSKELDASCLRIGLVGFLPMEDPRIIGTIDAIQSRLMPKGKDGQPGFVQRYDTKTSPDGLPSGEGAFLACSFWLVTNLWLIGRQAEARALYDRLLALRNDVGLLAEEWDPDANRMVGNFPQALSHIAMTHAAYAITGAWHPERPIGSPL
jgi:GH15 family glucan-1,4-alpha-glucosidase